MNRSDFLDLFLVYKSKKPIYFYSKTPQNRLTIYTIQ